jgi:hypothetical protein
MLIWEIHRQKVKTTGEGDAAGGLMVKGMAFSFLLGLVVEVIL